VTLSVDTQFGAFRIMSLLGVGGMGEVYRAHDTKLGRDVALKVLPAPFRSDSERLARFEREARALAALNHPNIATIHGVEEHRGIHALVLELVEGETLAERIARRPVPVAEALDIARQLVDGLDAAHERGLVHRDLKPANIKVGSSGLVKVLDFGLAKAMDPSLSDSGATVALSQSPTISSGGTRSGIILGTAAYMSPEQARGKTVDKRADIWAFGCVVYETLTGRVAFPGDTLSDTIVAILDRTPDWSAIPSGTPAIVVRLLRRCLEKDARRRLRDIGDAHHDLDEAFKQPERAAAFVGSSPPERRVVFQRITDLEGVNEAPAIAPDGKTVAFAAVVAGKRQIWIRLLSGGAPLQLTRDNADHLHPRWAPDSSTLIYFTPSTGSDTGTIWEIGALGGWPRRVASSIGAGDISHDGQRVALLQFVDDQVLLVLTARDGSRASRLVALPPSTYSRPQWSPDDRSIAVQRLGQNAFDGHIEVIDVASGERSEVVGEAWLQGFAWLADGSGFVYSSSRDSSILYPPVFNLRVVRRDGSANRQLTYGDHSYVDPDVHASGKLVAGRITSRADIWKIPVSGSPAENARAAVRITRQTGQVRVPSVSPDEREVVFVSDSGGHANLWIAATDGSAARPITFETAPGVSLGVPVWSPRGDLIAFVRIESAQGALWGVGPDGSNLRQLVRGWAPSFSADGAWLYYWRLDVEPGRVERMPIDGGPAEIVRDGSTTTLTAISPDGSTLFLVQAMRGSVGHFGSGVFTFDRARPPGGPAETIARITGVRMPERLLTLTISPDGRQLATFLQDGATTNIWLQPTDGGPMKPVTDFGDRSVTMTRSMSWSRDSQHIYAAVAETQTDIVLLDGLF
jgi:serine/threonine protein kinase